MTSTHTYINPDALKKELRFAFANYSEVGFEAPMFVYEVSSTPDLPASIEVSIDVYGEVEDSDGVPKVVRESGWSPVDFSGEYILSSNPQDVSDVVLDYEV